MTSPRWVAAIAIASALAATVTVAGQRRLTVTPTAADAAVSDLLDRYAKGEADIADVPAASLAGHLQQLRRVTPRWVGPKDAPGAARRRLAVATYVVEIVDLNFVDVWRLGSAYDLLTWACELVREAPALPTERGWHLALITLLERSHAFVPSRTLELRRRPVDPRLQDHIVHAEARFPGDGQWALARAIDRELVTWPMPIAEQGIRLPATVEGPIADAYRKAAESPDVRDEAYVRWGLHELRQGAVGDALPLFDRVGEASDDRALRYWLHLFRGRALGESRRGAEAVQSFQRAFAEVPYAQSATLALGAALAGERRAAEAGDLVGRMLAVESPIDPWRFYGFPAYRYWPALIADLRESIKP